MDTDRDLVTKQRTYSSALATMLSEIEYSCLPDEVAQTAKLCVLDTIGVALAATRWPWSQMVAENVCEDGGASQALVWGRSTRVPAHQAALANGTAAHGIELDDRAPIAQIHPGSMSIPAALAVAEKIGASGSTFLAGVVAGYELGVRVGKAVHFNDPGLYNANHKGVWLGVAAAGRTMGLNQQEMLDAFGIAGSMACGIAEYIQDERGSMSKRLIGGLAASHGVLAATLAKRGMTGPRTAIEGTYGYGQVFGANGELQFEELTRNLGDSYGILERETKPYASWGGGQNAIDAVRNLLQNHQIDPRQVAAVRIGGSEFLLKSHDIRAPTTITAAQMSLPFLTAIAICRGAAALMNPEIWLEDRVGALLNDPEILRLSQVAELHLDDEIQDVYLKTRHYGGARVQITMTDGHSMETYVEHSKGTIENPMSTDDIQLKFRTLAGTCFPERRVEAIMELVFGLDTLDDLRRFTRFLDPAD